MANKEGQSNNEHPSWRSQLILLLIAGVIGGASGAITGWALPNRNAQALEDQVVLLQEQLIRQELQVRRDVYGSLATLLVTHQSEDERLVQAQRDSSDANSKFDSGEFEEAAQLWDTARLALKDGCLQFQNSIDSIDGIQPTQTRILDDCGKLVYPTMDPLPVLQAFPLDSEPPQ